MRQTRRVCASFLYDTRVDSNPSRPVTRLLEEIAEGRSQAADELMPLVYTELRKLAMAKLAHEKPGQTLQATGLVHEAYLRLVDVEKVQHWNSRGHFFGAAAEAMRRVLVDNARQKRSAKRGGDYKRQDLSALQLAGPVRDDRLLELDEALVKLEASDKRSAEVVKLRFFAGLTIPEVANALGVSRRTADSIWAYARSWLMEEMADQDPPPENNLEKVPP